MGIKDFSKIFTYTREVKFADLKNKKIAIDAMTEIWRASLGAMNKLTDANGNPTIHINVILAIILDLQKNNIKQIWVFDHNKIGHNTDKLEEIEKRREKRKNAKNELDEIMSKEFKSFHDENRITILEKQAFSIDSLIISDILTLLTYFNIQYMEAPEGYEAEAICASLNKNGIVDGVYSSDTDAVAFGALTLWRRNPRDKKIYEYVQSDIFKQITDITENESSIEDIKKISVIMGTDFCEKTKGIGAKTVIKKYKNISLTEKQNRCIDIYTNVPSSTAEFKDFQYNLEVADWLADDKAFNRERVLKLITKNMK
jgi:5'-3' exonuclease